MLFMSLDFCKGFPAAANHECGAGNNLKFAMGRPTGIRPRDGSRSHITPTLNHDGRKEEMGREREREWMRGSIHLQFLHFVISNHHQTDQTETTKNKKTHPCQPAPHAPAPSVRENNHTRHLRSHVCFSVFSSFVVLVDCPPFATLTDFWPFSSDRA
ncbi:hypothetical protein VTO42DRAFT_6378 [Malbranchea cinnamomea]